MWDRAESNIRLGARIRTNSPQGPWIDDPANDKVISVDPGEKDYSRKFRIPSDVSSGYYDAGWVIVNQNTDEYQVAEAWVDENIMNRILYIESSAQPDLIVEDIWVDPDPPIAGASNRIRYRIKNLGGGDAVETFRTNRYFDGALDGHADTSGLTAGSTKTYYNDMTWPSDSNLHTIKAITDVNDAISESNEGNNERSESFSAECSIPDAPTLTSPGTSSEPGEEINTLTPTFRWNSVSNADSYGLYISKYPYGSGNLVFEQEGITGTSFNLPGGYLQDGVKYRWNMKAFNGAGESGYSSRLYFWVNILQPPSAPTLISPGTSSEPGEEINTLTPTFRWNSVSNADSYGLYISKYPYGSGNIIFEQDGLIGTSFNLPSGYLQDGVKYRGNMKAFNGAGESGYSSRLYFWVNILQPPSAPTLISPGTSSEPGEEINTLTPTFRWNSVSNADSYGLYISKYPYGSGNIIFEQEGITGTSFNLPSGYLQDGVKYRWNMKAFNSVGEGMMSLRKL
jgi:hypothetical protein